MSSAPVHAVFCDVDPSRFSDVALSTSTSLTDVHDHNYLPENVVRYTRRIIEGMGGCGVQLDACASKIYVEWAACRHLNSSMRM